MLARDAGPQSTTAVTWGTARRPVTMRGWLQMLPGPMPTLDGVRPRARSAPGSPRSRRDVSHDQLDLGGKAAFAPAFARGVEATPRHVGVCEEFEHEEGSRPWP